ncbi:T9SS type A sorting domain-containing protein [Dyadobacter sp. NIV53]|uniref:DUF7619 domain-containing protein n=1 Tax=Dyadobacter sp. NIV53 TaxID=2861765 RepID=UPI001C873090|nr:T9SS type A sorting domain-containing protein [Dyadobacter sp. NIV53]
MNRAYLKGFWILLFSINFSYSTYAQITVTTTDVTSCKKPDGKAVINVNTTATGLALEYSINGNAFQSSGTFDNLSEGAYTATIRDKDTQCSFSKSFVINNPSNNLKVSLSGLGTTEFCNNAKPPTITLTASASGGSGGYKYSWPDGTISVSSSGKQSVIATDTVTGCTASIGGDVIFVPIVCSRDPNDIVGPVGFGPKKMIAKSKQQSYMIRFENDPDFATAPAQVVKINHPLDANVNPYSLRLGDFGFAGLTFTVPLDKTFYSTRLDVTDSLGVVVDVTAGIDAVKKEAFWIFESKDANTGLPPADASLGFLPVNDSTAVGEGYVTYLIKAASPTVTGDVIHAKASIVFDANSSIETPEITNVIDAEPPVSTLTPLPEISDSTAIVLSWKGEDEKNGSGVHDYSLYVSENDGPYQLHLQGLTTKTTTFYGKWSTNYCFYIIATDNVGNIEAMKTSCEAKTTVGPGDPFPVKWIYFKGRQVAEGVLLNWATAMEESAENYFIQRSLNGKVFTDIGSVPASGNSSETNNYHFTDSDALSLHAKTVYYRLRQVDIDGKQMYSVIIVIHMKLKETDPVVSAYPNPFVQNITLEILNVTDTKESDNVTLYAKDGKKMYTKKLRNINKSTVLLNDLPQLGSGVYLLKTSINEKLYTIKMIKE